SRGLFEISENGGIALAQISGHYLGSFGSIVLAVTITFACLKTSIGLVTSCADTFKRMFPNSFSYKIWAIIFTVVSFLFSNFGLSKIISYSVPVLMFLYPLAITLILLALTEKLFGKDRIVYVCVTGFTCVAALFDLFKTLPEAVQNTLNLRPLIAFAEKYLPLYEINLGWVVPAAIGLAIGLIIHFCSCIRKHQ
ncbi:MAG: branched-chain amino acid transport system II carrier protein, partial [Clostridiales bacterium]|nr:branched-chain amino acid transport system II carrier protein [Clostridiales bacterium]